MLYPEQIIAKRIIDSFPRSGNGFPYLSTKSGKKIFFSVFIQKYGLDGGGTKYNHLDLKRRLTPVEFFDYMFKDYNLKPFQDKYNRGRELFVIDSHFHRILIQVMKKGRLEILSFYPHVEQNAQKTLVCAVSFNCSGRQGDI